MFERVGTTEITNGERDRYAQALHKRWRNSVAPERETFTKQSLMARNSVAKLNE